MATAARLIEALPETAINLLPLPPEFTPLAAELLGNAGHDSDGFPALFSEAVRGFATGPEGLPEVDVLLDEADVASGVAVENTLVEETALLAANVETGRGIVGAIDDLEKETAGEPEPILTGGGGGGGGGDGGGGGGGCDPARLVDVFLDGIFIGSVCDRG